jgi:uncharacterized Zn-finger protein
MSEETNNMGKREDVIFVSPEGPNARVVCITIQRPEMVVNGNSHPRIYREIKPVDGKYILRHNALYYDEQRSALESFAKRYGLKRVASRSASFM